MSRAARPSCPPAGVRPRSVRPKSEQIAAPAEDHGRPNHLGRREEIGVASDLLTRAPTATSEQFPACSREQAERQRMDWTARASAAPRPAVSRWRLVSRALARAPRSSSAEDRPTRVSRPDARAGRTREAAAWPRSGAEPRTCSSGSDRPQARPQCTPSRRSTDPDRHPTCVVRHSGSIRSKSSSSR